MNHHAVDDSDHLLAWLQEWYVRHCNGDWEHGYGVRIDTLDNPGWIVRIDLKETELEARPFKAVRLERTDTDWMHCWRTADQFEAAGGPRNLAEIPGTFRDWCSGTP